MKKFMFFTLLVLLPFTATAQQEVVTSEDGGQQVMLGDNERLTVFSGENIYAGDPVCVYMDSRNLESEGYDAVEWYYLGKIDKHYVIIEKKGSRLNLPSFVSSDEEFSTMEIPLTGSFRETGVLNIHNTKIRIAVADQGSITAEIIK